MIGAAATRCRLRRHGFPPVLPVWWLEQPRRHLGGSPVDESLVILPPSGKHRTLVKRLLIPAESADEARHRVSSDGEPLKPDWPVVAAGEPPHEGDLTDFFKVLA